MIARLKGTIEHVGTDRILLVVADVGYELLVPGADIERLSRLQGQPVTLFTINYLEGSAAGGQIVPRLIGFLRADDKAFFELFITVDGLGPRKALRAMTIPVGRLAAAIESGQAALLAELPGIGRRTADKVIATLKGKLERFATGEVVEAATKPMAGFESEALEVLLQLGERRPEAEQWIRKAVARDPSIDSAQRLIQEVYRVRNL
ncbi:MAG: Holliday junction ATP-dependent DNA helicase RuvA [Phycisphaerae bacterium]|nr:Holliday junction ATP-dependent DNA helicase RuvA [Phycisphaerae bacterium]